MQTGAIVRYRQHPEDQTGGFPAIVMHEWEDGSLQLYVLQFDHPTNIRAAHPTQVAIMVDPDRLAEQEMIVESLTKTAVAQERRIRALEAHLTGTAPAPPVESTPEVAEEAEPVMAGGEPNRRKPWPKK